METLRDRVDEIDGIDADCKRALGQWLDGAKPPQPHDLNVLLATIRRLAAGLDRPERLDLATLAAELVYTGRPDQPLRSPEARAIADMVGTADGREGIDAFFNKRKPEFKGH